MKLPINSRDMSRNSSSTSTISLAPDESVRSGGTQRWSLDDVRDQAASEVALRLMNGSKTVDGVRLGVLLITAKAGEFSFLNRVAAHVEARVLLDRRDFLFAVATTGSVLGKSPNEPAPPNSLLIYGSQRRFVGTALLLATCKFLGRVNNATLEPVNEPFLWFASVNRIRPPGLASPSADEAALWDVIAKSSRPPMDPQVPPPGSMTATTRLALARAKLERLAPRKAFEELTRPARRGWNSPTYLVDIRAEAERAATGGIHGALVIERNQLEFVLDPAGPASERLGLGLDIPRGYDIRIIVFDQHGRASSLAAVALQEIGLLNATDVIGGFVGWREAGLPTDIEEYVAEEGVEEELRSDPSVIRVL